MAFVIENEQLKASFNCKGAELTSLLSKQDEIEYIWQGDPKYWGRHAPVLFPFVGRLKDNHYSYQGKVYEMSQHGFARDKEFEVVKQSATSLSFVLKSDQETLSIYPFSFELILTYTLLENELMCQYHVINAGEEEMYFSIGGHPAFNVPIASEGTFEDYFLHFSPKKSRLIYPLEGPYVNLQEKTLGQTNTDIALTRELFKKDALIYETKGENSFEIKSDCTQHSIKLSYDEMPYVGIWSPYPAEAPFVCIEPWCGIADSTEATGCLSEKMGINRLLPRQEFQRGYRIALT